MVTAAVAIGILVLALAALWFAGENGDARAENARLRAALAQAVAAKDAAAAAAAGELARFRAERDMYVKRLHESEDVIASSPDPVARRAHLRELGKLLTGAAPP